MKYIYVLLFLFIGFNKANAQANDVKAEINDSISSANIFPGDCISKINYDSLGKVDAIKYYHKYKVPGTTSFFCGLFFRIGLTAAMYFTAPLDKNLSYPDTLLMRNETYSNAYVHQARKIKRRKIRQNFLIGFGILSIIVLPNVLYPDDDGFAAEILGL